MNQEAERRLFLSFLGGSRRYFALGALAALLMTGCDLTIPQLIRIAVDGRHWTLAMAACIAGTALAGAFFRWLSATENSKAGERLVKNMQDRLYSHISRLPYAWHQAHPTGDIIQRCTSDVTMIKEFCSEQLYQLARIILMIVLALSFMFSMHVRLTAVTLVFIPCIVAYSAVFLLRIREQFLKCDENEGVLSAIAQENLTGVRVVRAFGQEAAEERRFRAQNDIYTDCWMELCRILAWFWGLGDLASGLMVMTVVLLGACYCVGGTLTAGSYIAFIAYTNMLVAPIRALGRMISELSKSEVSLRRIADILSAKTEKGQTALPGVTLGESHSATEQNAETEQAQQGFDAGQNAETKHSSEVKRYSGAEAEGRAAPEISFRQVSFSFGENQVLRNISFTVPAGSTVGILGGTGSGKSTLVQLLLRLYELPPDGGSITLDGKDIRALPIRELRQKIGIVLQEPFLFSGTIGENITIAAKQRRENALSGGNTRNTDSAETERQRAEAAETACLTETIQEFPEGFDTLVGERGVTLSGGQKQRVAIARLLMEQKPVMIFDDALSAVDAETEHRIRLALREKLAGATVFLISHRVSTLADADRIYVMESGSIAEAGTHRELLEKNGRYAEIFRLQSLPEESGKETAEKAPAEKALPEKAEEALV